MGCDRYPSVVENMVAVARHIESTLAMERFGVATAKQMLQPFLVAQDAARPAPWRAILGDLKSVEEVQSAFRRLSVDYHPDKSTGSHAAMAELSCARDDAIQELEATPAEARAVNLDDEVIVFESERDFGAMREAERFLEEQGFSYGLNERGSPRGIQFGLCDIAKWRDLTAEERAELDGRMTGDMRSGPVTVVISRAAMALAEQAAAQRKASR
jgi:hypothetical protein